MNTILAVDDTTENLAFLEKILVSEGYKMQLSNSGEAALAAIQVKMPDLILLDIRMPGMDGFAVLRYLKENIETKGVPVIMLSAFGEVDDWVQCLQMGAADYVCKPIQDKELLTRIKTQLSLNVANTLLVEQTAKLEKVNEQLRLEIIEHKKIEDELKAKVHEQEVFQKAVVNRELRIIELKNRIKELEGRLSIEPSAKVEGTKDEG